MMKKFAAACFAALAIIAAAGTTAFAATETTTCTNCKGSGKAVCTWCDGEGYMTAAGTKYKCISCGATGIRDCLHCLGKGTKTTDNRYAGCRSGTCAARSRPGHDRQPGHASLSRHGNHEHPYNLPGMPWNRKKGLHLLQRKWFP